MNLPVALYMLSGPEWANIVAVAVVAMRFVNNVDSRRSLSKSKTTPLKK